jgi:hypothetical protein
MIDDDAWRTHMRADVVGPPAGADGLIARK